MPVIPVEQIETVEFSCVATVSTEALPLRLSRDRSMRQVLRTSIWTAGGYGRAEMKIVCSMYK